jgi:hypothetical protein
MAGQVWCKTPQVGQNAARETALPDGTTRGRSVTAAAPPGTSHGAIESALEHEIDWTILLSEDPV